MIYKTLTWLLLWLVLVLSAKQEAWLSVQSGIMMIQIMALLNARVTKSALVYFCQKFWSHLHQTLYDWMIRAIAIKTFRPNAKLRLSKYSSHSMIEQENPRMTHQVIINPNAIGILYHPNQRKLLLGYLWPNSKGMRCAGLKHSFQGAKQLNSALKSASPDFLELFAEQYKCFSRSKLFGLWALECARWYIITAASSMQGKSRTLMHALLCNHYSQFSCQCRNLHSKHILWLSGSANLDA